jgi:hypothetical protein
MRWLRAVSIVCVLGLLLLPSGCIKGKQTVKINPDGSGTIKIHQVLGEQLSSMITGFAEKGHEQEAMDKSLIQDLAKWENVVAWTDAKATLKDGHVVTDATGYFEDATKLGNTSNKARFAWKKNDDGGFSLTWIAEKDEAQKDPFSEKGQANLGQAQQMKDMFKGLKMEQEFTLPGKVTKTSTQAHEGRNATMTVTDEDILKILDLGDSLKKKIDAGETTKEKAMAEMEKAMSGMDRIEITCAAGSVDDEVAQFKKDLEAAKASYKGSELAKAVAAQAEKAKKEKSGEGE